LSRENQVIGSRTGDEGAQAGRREELKAQNRAKLLTAARKVFAEKGLGEATARDIVRETDLASGTFYNYFRDKEEVFRALLEEFEQRTREATLHLRRDQSLPLEQRVEQGARAWFQVVVEDAELFLVLSRNTGAMVPAGVLFGSGMAEFAEDLEMWSEEGDLPGVDLEYLGAAIAGASLQVASCLVERDPPDPDEAARFCSKMVLGTIAALAENLPALTAALPPG
jgi:AcrR family transcriptional regulator